MGGCVDYISKAVSIVYGQLGSEMKSERGQREL